MEYTKRDKKTIEQLIEVAKANRHKLVVDSDNSDLPDAQRFIIALKIKEGGNKIKAKILYQAYKAWARQPIAKIAFCKQFSDIIPKLEINNGTYYSINYKPMQLVNKVNRIMGIINEKV